MSIFPDSESFRDLATCANGSQSTNANGVACTSVVNPTSATCNPDDYGVQRPALPAQPMIRPVNFNRRVSLAELAPLIGTPTNYLRTLNPALTDGHTAASGPHRVWIPEHRVDHLEHRLARHSDLALLEYGLYRVQRGDTLSHIAVRHGTSTRALREMNALASSSIRAGVELRVPLHGGSPRTDL